MWRLKIFLLFIAVLLAAWGRREWEASRGVSPEPIEMGVEDLESGKKPPNRHVRLKSHFSLYSQIMYASRHEGDGNTVVHDSWYPILSLEHPFVIETKKNEVNFPGGLLPEGVDPPEIKKLSVLVKTSRFGLPSEFPEPGIEVSDPREGLIGLAREVLTEEEQDLLRQSGFKGDLASLYVLEENRKPQEAKPAIIKFAGSAVAFTILAVWTYWIFCRRRRFEPKKQVQTRTKKGRKSAVDEILAET
ncbi:MAG: hypothetical protein AAF514_01425 [Verrucomicrobiota bacterium]